MTAHRRLFQSIQDRQRHAIGAALAAGFASLGAGIRRARYFASLKAELGGGAHV